MLCCVVLLLSRLCVWYAEGFTISYMCCVVLCCVVLLLSRLCVWYAEGFTISYMCCVVLCCYCRDCVFGMLRGLQ